MNSSPLVSIIINNYNYESFVRDAIDSALSQTFNHIEVIVVDDGSTDNSHQAITSYGDRILAIFQENGKQAAALNTGLTESRGEIVIFLDSDDYLYPQAVEHIVEAWEPGIAKVHYRLEVVDGNNQPRGFFYPPAGRPLPQGDVLDGLIKVGSYASTPMSGNAYWREPLSKVFPIPDAYKLTADDYLMISIPFHGRLAGIEKPLGAYRIHDTNQWAMAEISGSRFRRFVRHDLQNYALLVQRAKEFGYETPPDLEFRSLGRLWSRLASLRLEPYEHPIPSDRPWLLIRRGIKALWQYSTFNWQKRLIYSVWFFWVGLLPVPLAKLGVGWLYAPHLRPKPVDRILTQLRTLVSN